MILLNRLGEAEDGVAVEIRVADGVVEAKAEAEDEEVEVAVSSVVVSAVAAVSTDDEEPVLHSPVKVKGPAMSQMCGSMTCTMEVRHQIEEEVAAAVVDP